MGCVCCNQHPTGDPEAIPLSNLESMDIDGGNMTDYGESIFKQNTLATCKTCPLLPHVIV